MNGGERRLNPEAEDLGQGGDHLAHDFPDVGQMGLDLAGNLATLTAEELTDVDQLVEHDLGGDRRQEDRRIRQGGDAAFGAHEQLHQLGDVRPPGGGEQVGPRVGELEFPRRDLRLRDGRCVKIGWCDDDGCQAECAGSGQRGQSDYRATSGVFHQRVSPC